MFESMMTSIPRELVGRSSSHFTRLARIFALELEVPHIFRPVFDLKTLDAGAYANNPALKIPILVDDRGPLFGSENICRELVRAAGSRGEKVILRGDLPDRAVANAEELTLHVMSSEVSMIMAKMSGDASLAPPKIARSLENCLDHLDQSMEAILTALPADRTLSFVETAIFCVVRHLPFREVMEVSRWARLAEHCARFGERESARKTEYRFDVQ